MSNVKYKSDEKKQADIFSFSSGSSAVSNKVTMQQLTESEINRVAGGPGAQVGDGVNPPD